MKSADDILAALRDPSIPMTHAQIKDAWNILKRRNNTNAALAVHAFHIGAKVAFEARGATWTGTVKKINQKSVSVLATMPGSPASVEWKVSPNLLRPQA